MFNSKNTALISLPLAILSSFMLAQSAVAAGGISTTAMLAAVTEIYRKPVTVPTAQQTITKQEKIMIHDDVWVAKAKKTEAPKSGSQ